MQFKADSEIILVIVASTLVLLLLVGFLVTFVLFHQKKKVLYYKNTQLLKSTYEQELLKTQIEIQEQTFVNIRQEIHDNIGQVLGLAKLNLNTIPDAGDKIIESKNLISKAIVDLRNLSQSLHGDRIAEIGLQAAINKEVNSLNNSGIYIATLNTSGQAVKLDTQKTMVIFRMVQECLNNIVKHAEAKEITINLNYLDLKLELCINDNGKGFDIEKLAIDQQGLGLKSMDNRATLIGADLKIVSVANVGTKITVTLPY